MPLSPPLTKFTTKADAIVSYDYSDLASGLAYSKFYPVIVNSTTRFLSNTDVTSKASSYNYVVATAQTDAKIVSSAFTTARTIKGEVLFDFDSYCAGNATQNITVKLQLYSGGAYTDIATATMTITGTNGTTYQVLGKATATETLVKVGDSIALNVTTPAAFGMNSNNDTNINTVNVPFKVE